MFLYQNNLPGSCIRVSFYTLYHNKEEVNAASEVPVDGSSDTPNNVFADN